MGETAQHATNPGCAQNSTTQSESKSPPACGAPAPEVGKLHNIHRSFTSLLMRQIGRWWGSLAKRAKERSVSTSRTIYALCLK